MNRRSKRGPLKSQGVGVDKGLFLLTFLLTIFGLLAIADASAPQAQTFFNDSLFYVKQQLVWAVFGLFILIIFSNIHYSFWKKLATPFLGATVATLVAVLIPGIGSKFLGARRWLSLGPFGFQPSELVKLSLSIYFASLWESKKPLKSYILVLAAILGLIMLQPDLGTAIIIAGIGFLQIYAAGIPLISIATILVGGAASALILILTSDYRRERLLTFLGLSQDHQGSSYHIRQVLIAIGSGGLFGVGVGHSRQKFLFLPEAATDSVFAIIAEEIGFFGSAVLIAMFLLLIYKCIKIAANAPDRFSSLLTIGITSWIAVQFFLNLSSMVAITPLTGVPLPFFSYGGSSLTMILLGIGIVLNISRYSSK